MKSFNEYLNEFQEVGSVQKVIQSLCFVVGLPHLHPYELVVFENGDQGQVLSLSEKTAEVLLLSKININVGAKVARTNQVLKVPVSTSLLGSVIDPLGRSFVGFEKFKESPVQNEYFPVDTPPGGILDKKPVQKPLETGVTLVDLVVPLAKGQRQLIIGDRKTGKTLFLLQTVLTQARNGTICIYAAIGQRRFDIAKLYAIFKENNILSNTLIVASVSTDPAGLIYTTPYTAITIAEYFMNAGTDVLVVLDDMSNHARTYREISLLAGRFPGRNAYPGDIFHVHARLIERARN